MTKRKPRPCEMQAQPRPCRTCPFEGEEPIGFRPESLAEYTRKIIALESQHLCHSANNEKICRGGRNLMLRVMCAQGLIEAPTDEAFDKANQEMQENKDGGL